MATEQDRFNDDGGDNLRDALAAAFDSAEGTDDPPAAKAEQAEQPEQDDAQANAQANAQAKAGDGSQGRDAQGRFASKQAATDPAAEGANAPAVGPGAAQGATNPPAGGVPPAPPPGELKAPASWKPQARELWAQLPAQVREEVTRREVEAGRNLEHAAAARQFVDAFESVVRPYEMFIRAENSNPLQAVSNLMQTAAELRVGTAQSKAQLVAGMIQNFGVDVVLLDGLLAGLGVTAQAQQQAPMRDPRVDQLLWRQQQYEQQQVQAIADGARNEIAGFGANHEFFGDVRAIMADLVDYRAKQGQQVDLEKIYAQACQMHEGVSSILQQRSAAAKATTQSQAAHRARRAAVSLKSEATPDDGATVPKNDSIRAALEAALEAHSDS